MVAKLSRGAYIFKDIQARYVYIFCTKSETVLPDIIWSEEFHTETEIV